MMTEQAAIVGSQEFIVVVLAGNVIINRRIVGMRINRENPQLARSVSEEADLSLTVLPIFTSLGSVPRWVKPTLKHPVCELAGVAAATPAAPVLGADGAGVVESPGVAAAGLLAGVSEGAVGPVVAAAASAPPDLELVHAEVVGGVGIRVVVVGVHIVGQEFVKKRLL